MSDTSQSQFLIYLFSSLPHIFSNLSHISLLTHLSPSFSYSLFESVTHLFFASLSRTFSSLPHLFSIRNSWLGLCTSHVTFLCLATISRPLKIRGLFCKRALQKRLYSAKETYTRHIPLRLTRHSPLSFSESLIYLFESLTYLFQRISARVSHILFSFAPHTSHLFVFIHSQQLTMGWLRLVGSFKW